MTARKPQPNPRGGARPGAGRPRTRPEGARKVQVVLSPAAAQAWAAHEGDRSAWVSWLIEAATPVHDQCTDEKGCRSTPLRPA